MGNETGEWRVSQSLIGLKWKKMQIHFLTRSMNKLITRGPIDDVCTANSSRDEQGRTSAWQEPKMNQMKGTARTFEVILKKSHF